MAALGKNNNGKIRRNNTAEAVRVRVLNAYQSDRRGDYGLNNFLTLNALGFFSLIILLIVYFQASNYLDDKNPRLKRLWLSAISYTFAVQLLDLISRLSISIQAPSLRLASYVFSAVLFVSVTAMSCRIALFINYSIESSERVYAGLSRFFRTLVAISALVTLASIPFGGFFTIDAGNNYRNGSFYPVSIFISYMPLFTVLLRSAVKSRNKSTKTLMITGVLFPTYFVFLQVTDISPIPVIFPSITTFILIMNSLLTINAMYIDYLTGLKNARGIDKYFAKLSGNSGRHLMVLFIDFDGFKNINDMYGHKEGDNALCAFAKILNRVFRQSDLIARIGGDEFLIASPVAKAADADEMVGRVRREVEKFNNASAKAYKISVSYGYSLHPPGAKPDKDLLMDEADRKMYEEKSKNCVKPSAAGK